MWKYSSMCKGGIPFICHTLSTLESISRLRVGDAFFISAKAPLKSSRSQAFKSGEEVRRGEASYLSLAK